MASSYTLMEIKMSKPWYLNEYVSSELMWQVIDDLVKEYDILAMSDEAVTSESYKMFSMGRREALGRIMDALKEDSKCLYEILHRHDVNYERSE